MAATGSEAVTLGQLKEFASTIPSGGGSDAQKQLLSFTVSQGAEDIIENVFGCVDIKCAYIQEDSDPNSSYNFIVQISKIGKVITIEHVFAQNIKISPSLHVPLVQFGFVAREGYEIDLSSDVGWYVVGMITGNSTQRAKRRIETDCFYLGMDGSYIGNSGQDAWNMVSLYDDFADTSGNGQLSIDYNMSISLL